MTDVNEKMASRCLRETKQTDANACWIADYMEIIYSYANYSWHLWNMALLTPSIK